MEIVNTDIPDVKIIVPKVFGDHRGYFVETFNEKKFLDKIGPVQFVQDNQSFSVKGTLRGLHYQIPPYAQAKLVRVTLGSVIDFAVDIRKGSPTFGHHVAVELSAENHRQLWIPRGFAHGFFVTSEVAIFQYKVDNYYSKECDRGIRFDDPSLGIREACQCEAFVLSEKDSALPFLAEATDLFN
ncbi:dTDP-4-dehydrorhamnose 3,5-epimerase [Bdellovibrio bacteriovorus]|uniref:dTDP-4-dehydrorhamnose 3,5-epimerase n=1 Tax=Bdellovibrio bacteriovorus TaxID=959 RepID=UPI0035A73D2C